jgi:hypothetical protein
MLPVTAAPALAAVVISVNGTTGADASACGAPSAPCRTIQYAYSRRAASGGTIKVAAGTYDLARSFLIDGVANVAFDGAQAGVDAKGRSPACSDKTETVITTTSSALPIKTALFDAEKDGITVNGFCFKGGSPNGVVGLESSAAGPDGGGASASGFMFENNIFTASRRDCGSGRTANPYRQCGTTCFTLRPAREASQQVWVSGCTPPTNGRRCTML